MTDRDKTITENLKIIVKAMDDKKAYNIQILDIKDISPIADYFVICSGSNIRQTQTIADEVDEKMSEYNIHATKIDDTDLFGNPLKEGYDTGKWILLDYNGIVVHIFSEDERDYYNLDKIWSDAKTVDLNKLKEM